MRKAKLSVHAGDVKQVLRAFSIEVGSLNARYVAAEAILMEKPAWLGSGKLVIRYRRKGYRHPLTKDECSVHFLPRGHRSRVL